MSKTHSSKLSVSLTMSKIINYKIFIIKKTNVSSTLFEISRFFHDLYLKTNQQTTYTYGGFAYYATAIN